MVHSLISESVFAIPLLCFLFSVRITPEITAIIILFQVLSAFSMQLGKNVQPEYSAGGLTAFILYAFYAVPLYPSIIAGAAASYLLIPVFEARQRFNIFAAEKLKAGWAAVAASSFVSLVSYISIYSLAIVFMKFIGSIYRYNDGRMAAFAMVFPFAMFAEDLFSSKKSALFITGGVISGALAVLISLLK